MEQDALRVFYENEGEEELRLKEGGAQYLEFVTATRYLSRCLPEGCSVLDSCAGTGAYAFFLAEGGHRVTAGDLVPYNVEIMEKKRASGPALEEIYCGDALDLSRFAAESFDAVLCMGALYHLDRPEDRRRAVTESLGVLREEGLFVCTYMNRYAVILNNARGDVENIDEIMTFVQEGREGIFYASTPEEMTAHMEELGLEILRHVALDGMACYLHSTLGLLDEVGFLRWRRYHLAVCEVPSLLGSSYHNMLICRKK